MIQQINTKLFGSEPHRPPSLFSLFCEFLFTPSCSSSSPSPLSHNIDGKASDLTCPFFILAVALNIASWSIRCPRLDGEGAGEAGDKNESRMETF